MTERPPPTPLAKPLAKPLANPLTNDADFTTRIEAKVARKLKAQRDPAPGVWFGLGMMGLIGWSVAIPTLLGAALGSWLDGRLEGNTHSWTLALLVGGLCLGCLNAWRWVAKEEQAMKKDHDDE
jgi:ATP synthase protein I